MSGEGWGGVRNQEKGIRLKDQRLSVIVSVVPSHPMMIRTGDLVGPITMKTAKQVILGTAGHIDHGKTSLVKALTGVDTDRLQEEKERGITIELGFTFFDLPSGTRLGIGGGSGHSTFA